MLNVAFPYRLDDRGRTATANPDDHIREMLELLLFTRAGERVNRPDFGCGLLDLVFGPSSPEIAAALNITISAAIQRWLGDVITLTALDVTAHESELRVNLAYEVVSTGAPASATLTIPGTAQ